MINQKGFATEVLLVHVRRGREIEQNLPDFLKPIGFSISATGKQLFPRPPSRSNPLLIPPKTSPRRACTEQAQRVEMRRGRDSNPRRGYKPFTRFPSVRIRPLCHLSIIGEAIS